MNTTRTLTKLITAVTAAVALTAVLGAAPAAEAQTNSNCNAAGGYVINYLNGISNTFRQALDSRAALAAAEGTTHTGEPVTYSSLYNDTHGVVVDVEEVFQQKVREAVTAGILTEQQINTILSNVTGFAVRAGAAAPRALGWVLSKVPIDRVRNAAQGFNQFLDALPGWFQQAQVAVNDWMAGQVNKFADLTLLDAETRGIIDDHVALLRGQIASGRKPLIVSHSQGNLFANPVAQKVRAVAGGSSLGVVHVATPALLTSGPYVTIDTDLVIAPFFTANQAPLPNVSLAAFKAGSNHGFGDAYLLQGEQPRTKLLATVNSQLDTITLPFGTGSDGLFTVTLTWNGPGDTDLHVFEPDGTHVYYGSTIGHLGYLDVDNVTANGPEHYFAACSDAAVGGTFVVGVTNYRAPTGTIATIQLSSASFIGDPVTLTLGPATSSSSANTLLFRVSVTRTADGHLEVHQLPV